MGSIELSLDGLDEEMATELVEAAYRRADENMQRGNKERGIRLRTVAEELQEQLQEQR